MSVIFVTIQPKWMSEEIDKGDCRSSVYGVMTRQNAISGSREISTNVSCERERWTQLDL